LALTPSLFLELTLVEAAVFSVASATIFAFSATLDASSLTWDATALAASPLAASLDALWSHAPSPPVDAFGSSFGAKRFLTAAPLALDWASSFSTLLVVSGSSLTSFYSFSAPSLAASLTLAAAFNSLASLIGSSVADFDGSVFVGSVSGTSPTPLVWT
jgi:hypothetical protein